MNEYLYLHDPFQDLQRQHEAERFGMWVFLASEVLLFGGLLAGYGLYRELYTEAFVSAARETSLPLGTINTAILMTSSLTIAMAGRAAKARMTAFSFGLLIITFVLGSGFLLLKALEYHEDLAKHLLPGPSFFSAEPGALMFFTFYWLMTAVHALHVTGGLIAVLRLILMSWHDREWLRGSGSEEACALYWHLVDIVWIVLYPLLYLAGRANA